MRATSRRLRFPGRPLLRFALLALFLGAHRPGFVQGDIDDLFTDPDTGIIDESDEAMDLAAVTADTKPRFSGSARVDGGFILGMSEWGSPLAEPGTVGLLPFYALESTLNLDVRPAPYLRFYGSFGVSSPYTTEAGIELGFSPVLVDELFLDYTLAERLYFRLGKQSMTWGQGRLFNPGDFVSHAAGGISVKGFAPLGPVGLTAVAIGEGVVADPPSLAAIGERVSCAVLFETSLSALTLGMSAYYRSAPGLRTGAYLKRPVGRFDGAVEGVLDWKPDVAGLDSGMVLASLFWEGGRSRWQVILEYLYDTAVADYRGHSLGLGFTVRDWLPRGWRPGLRWVHGFADHAGQVVLGFDGPVAPHLRLAIGFPFHYGAADGYYRQVLVDSLPGVDFLESFAGGRLPGDPAAAMVVLLRLSLDF